MLKIIAWIETKALSDTSMAMTAKMLKENVGLQEDCILAVFQAMYETNKLLAEEVLRNRQKKSVIIAP